MYIYLHDIYKITYSILKDILECELVKMNNKVTQQPSNICGLVTFMISHPTHELLRTLVHYRVYVIPKGNPIQSLSNMSSRNPSSPIS